VYYAGIERALERGISSYDVGPSSLKTKLLRGAVLEPRWSLLEVDGLPASGAGERKLAEWDSELTTVGHPPVVTPGAPTSPPFAASSTPKSTSRSLIADRTTATKNWSCRSGTGRRPFGRATAVSPLAQAQSLGTHARPGRVPKFNVRDPLSNRLARLGLLDLGLPDGRRVAVRSIFEIAAHPCAQDARARREAI
jgi:hypothetical protein